MEAEYIQRASKGEMEIPWSFWLGAWSVGGLSPEVETARASLGYVGAFSSEWVGVCGCGSWWLWCSGGRPELETDPVRGQRSAFLPVLVVWKGKESDGEVLWRCPLKSC